MVKIKTRKLPGSILEPVIALMILVFAVTAAFVVVMQSSQSRHLPQHIRAQQLAAYTLHAAHLEQRFISEEFSVDGLLVEKAVSRMEAFDYLFQIEVRVYDNRRKELAHRKRIFNDKDDY